MGLFGTIWKIFEIPILRKSLLNGIFAVVFLVIKI
jgi:hypothetical protein